MTHIYDPLFDEAGKYSPITLLRKIEEHLAELADAWQRGAIREFDALGGTRSNRNMDLLFEIRKELTPKRLIVMSTIGATISGIVVSHFVEEGSDNTLCGKATKNMSTRYKHTNEAGACKICWRKHLKLEQK